MQIGIAFSLRMVLEVLFGCYEILVNGERISRLSSSSQASFTNLLFNTSIKESKNERPYKSN